MFLLHVYIQLYEYLGMIYTSDNKICIIKDLSIYICLYGHLYK